MSIVDLKLNLWPAMLSLKMAICCLQGRGTLRKKSPCGAQCRVHGTVQSMPCCSNWCSGAVHVVARCCPFSFQVVQSCHQVVPCPKWCPSQVLSTQFPRGAKWSPFMSQCGREMCSVSAFDLAAVAAFIYYVENRCERKKWVLLPGWSRDVHKSSYRS